MFLTRKRDSELSNRLQEQADRTRAHERSVVEKLLREEAREAKAAQEKVRAATNRVTKRKSTTARRPSVDREIIEHDDTGTVDDQEAPPLDSTVTSTIPASNTDAGSTQDVSIMDERPYHDSQHADTILTDDFAAPEFEGLWDEPTVSVTAVTKTSSRPSRQAMQNRQLSEALERNKAGPRTTANTSHCRSQI